MSGGLFKIIPIHGKRYTNLVVVSYVGKSLWLCQCDCGNQTIVRKSLLKSGNTKSCGCLSSRKTLGKRSTTHGKRKSRIYNVYYNMKKRCLNPYSPDYRFYGGRGIKVCDRWVSSFDAFLEDMGEPPTGTEQIDRIDNNGDYEPVNCRWVTASQNCRNRRSTKYISHNGITLSVYDWAERCNMKGFTLAARLASGWSVEKALTTPCRLRTNSVTDLVMRGEGR